MDEVGGSFPVASGSPGIRTSGLGTNVYGSTIDRLDGAHEPFGSISRAGSPHRQYRASHREAARRVRRSIDPARRRSPGAPRRVAQPSDDDRCNLSARVFIADLSEAVASLPGVANDDLSGDDPLTWFGPLPRGRDPQHRLGRHRRRSKHRGPAFTLLRRCARRGAGRRPTTRPVGGTNLLRHRRPARSRSPELRLLHHVHRRERIDRVVLPPRALPSRHRRAVALALGRPVLPITRLRELRRHPLRWRRPPISIRSDRTADPIGRGRRSCRRPLPGHWSVLFVQRGGGRCRDVVT